MEDYELESTQDYDGAIETCRERIKMLGQHREYARLKEEESSAVKEARKEHEAWVDSLPLWQRCICRLFELVLYILPVVLGVFVCFLILSAFAITVEAFFSLWYGPDGGWKYAINNYCWSFPLMCTYRSRV
jgi:hypothetical protein